MVREALIKGWRLFQSEHDSVRCLLEGGVYLSPVRCILEEI